MFKFKLSIVLGLISIAFAAPAQASIVFTLDQTASPGMIGPFGTVTLSQNGTNEVDVVVTLLNGTDFISSGNTNSHNGFAFNLDLNSSAYVINSLTSGFSYTAGQGRNVPWGYFTDLIECVSCNNGGSNPNPGPLTFNITDSAGINVSDLTKNLTGYYFSADVINQNVTGNVASGTMSPVPEPRTYAMLIAGLGMLGFLALRKSRGSAMNFA